MIFLTRNRDNQSSSLSSFNSAFVALRRLSLIIANSKITISFTYTKIEKSYNTAEGFKPLAILLDCLYSKFEIRTLLLPVKQSIPYQLMELWKQVCFSKTFRSIKLISDSPTKFSRHDN